MRTVFKIFIFLALPVLFAASCKEKPEPYEEPSVAAEPAPPAKSLTDPADCARKTVLTVNSFKNDCIGISFSSPQPFLYKPGPYDEPYIFFSVPAKFFSIQFFIFNNELENILSLENQQEFQEQIRKTLTSQNPDLKIFKAEYIFIDTVPVLYVEDLNKNIFEQHFYFKNKNVWGRLSFLTEANRYSDAAYWHNQIIMSIRFTNK